MKRFRRWMALGAALVLSSCSDGTGVTLELLRNKALWSDANLTSYTVMVTRRCFCLPESIGPVAVTVVNGQVHSRVYADGSGPVPAQYADLFPAVPGLFTFVESSMRLDPSQMRVEYHPELGYPTDVYVDFDARVADEEMGYLATVVIPD